MMTRKEGGMSDITWTNERRKLSQLQPWPRNPRQIKRDQARRLAESFDTFGQVETIAISPDGEIYNGHQRLNVLMDKHGGDYEVEVRVSSRALSEKEREKLTVFLHRGSTGEWDFDTLANEFEVAELIEWGFTEKELQLGGFDLTQDTKDAEPQIDKAEELREKWGVELGQLWQLGEHRLICGDCTDKQVVERVMGGEKAELCPTDPPYNVGFDYDGKTVDDSKGIDVYKKFTHDWFALACEFSIRQLITPGCNNLALWMRWFDAYHWATWIKRNTQTHGRVTHFWGWEPILFFGGGWVRRRQLDIYDFPAQFNTKKETANHPCSKPLAMWVDILQSHSEDASIILEPFSGSGTTLIACENLGRKCRAVEISPAYCAVAIQRWVDLTGGVPELLK